MTLAQIFAILLVIVAISDFLLCYFWLLPKIRKNQMPQLLEFLAADKRQQAEQQQKTIKKLKALMDMWVVIALAIAYFLWTNPDIV